VDATARDIHTYKQSTVDMINRTPTSRRYLSANVALVDINTDTQLVFSSKGPGTKGHWRHSIVAQIRSPKCLAVVRSCASS